MTTASRVLQQRAVELRQSSQGVFYIPNCGDSLENVKAQEEALSMTGDEAKKSLGLPTASMIFYGGHFEPGDDIMFFCRAAARAARRFGATIFFVGEGPDLPQVKDFFSQQPGVEVRFSRRLCYEEFLRLVAAADIAAFPYPDNSIYHSKCSVRMIDYMSMGKAVLSTAVGQNTDYILDGESGILTPPGDELRFQQELERLLHDPQLRARLGRNARQRVKDRFSWNAVVTNCLLAYRQLSES